MYPDTNAKIGNSQSADFSYREYRVDTKGKYLKNSSFIKENHRTDDKKTNIILISQKLDNKS